MLIELADHRREIRPSRDRIVVVTAPAHALDLLRIAALRSDDAVLVAPAPPIEARRYAQRFAFEVIERSFVERDLAEAAAVLVSLPDPDAENQVVRAARRRGVPVHVVDRPLVSDFTVLELLEQTGPALAGGMRR